MRNFFISAPFVFKGGLRLEIKSLEDFVKEYRKLRDEGYTFEEIQYLFVFWFQVLNK